MIALKRTAICLIILVGLFGCTAKNIHNNPNVERITSVEQARSEIKVGMSMSDVLGKWGEPNSKSIQNETVAWGYAYVTSTIYPLPGMKHKQSRFITITFKNDHVTHVDLSETQY